MYRFEWIPGLSLVAAVLVFPLAPAFAMIALILAALVAENAFFLAALFPGSMLGETTIRPVPRSDGTTDLYIKTESFDDVFCQDLPAEQAATMAVTQRPATQEALTEASGSRSLWQDVPSRFVIGEKDRVIPAALHNYMAERAHAHRTLEVPGASHAITVSHPQAVADQILEAAAVYATA